ncbi:hypothetical protein GPECTOR_2g968 [Gonium pectorale]|uniref:Uncharacterized protein n=1 Tax=Gonium pectorale TaxID=33097 RepID=A0A150H1R0_GONPE|nr:hypothetical protein GPECTOR_2g968 [Gonium pectorale]|eukprot:KXZ56086.1 hypothetical protein GPECTOR_2g968 [Gonium pectorale]
MLSFAPPSRLKPAAGSGQGRVLAEADVGPAPLFRSQVAASLFADLRRDIHKRAAAAEPSGWGRPGGGYPGAGGSVSGVRGPGWPGEVSHGATGVADGGVLGSGDGGPDLYLTAALPPGKRQRTSPLRGLAGATAAAATGIGAGAAAGLGHSANRAFLARAGASEALGFNPGLLRFAPPSVAHTEQPQAASITSFRVLSHQPGAAPEAGGGYPVVGFAAPAAAPALSPAELFGGGGSGGGGGGGGGGIVFDVRGAMVGKQHGQAGVPDADAVFGTQDAAAGAAFVAAAAASLHAAVGGPGWASGPGLAVQAASRGEGRGAGPGAADNLNIEAHASPPHQPDRQLMQRFLSGLEERSPPM